MKQVRNLRSERVAIYPPSVIPLNRIFAGSYRALLAKAFAFDTIAPSGEEIEFRSGAIDIGGSEIIVLSLKFDDRRVVFTIEGTAEDADRLADEIASIIFEGDEVPEPLIVVPATDCIATLEFDWTAIYSTQFVSFLEGHILPAASKGDAKPKVSAAVTQFHLKYQTPADLDEQAVVLSPATLTIGPEPRRPLSDRRYTTGSPTRSEEHLRLLEALESAMQTG